MHRLTLCAALLAALSQLSGCAVHSPAGAADLHVAQHFTAPPKGSPVLLLHLPANEAAYRHGDTEVRAMVRDALVSKGFRVGIVGPEDYMLAVRAELQQLHRATQQPSPAMLAQAEGRALATVSKVAAEVSGSRLLVRTRLLTRQAELWQSHARWDGVTRRIVFVDAKQGETPQNIEGTGTGVSVEVVAMGPEGRLLIKSYGGIALPFSASRYGPPVPARILFTREHLLEGVAIALAPLQPGTASNAGE